MVAKWHENVAVLARHVLIICMAWNGVHLTWNYVYSSTQRPDIIYDWPEMAANCHEKVAKVAVL